LGGFLAAFDLLLTMLSTARLPHRRYRSLAVQFDRFDMQLQQCDNHGTSLNMHYGSMHCEAVIE
jgi:hypothetical protein